MKSIGRRALRPLALGTRRSGAPTARSSVTGSGPSESAPRTAPPIRAPVPLKPLPPR
jgi:hypothetical protein